MNNHDINSLADLLAKKFGLDTKYEYDLAMSTMSVMNISYAVDRILVEHGHEREAEALMHAVTQLLAIVASEHPETGLESAIGKASQMAIMANELLSSLAEVEESEGEGEVVISIELQDALDRLRTC